MRITEPSMRASACAAAIALALVACRSDQKRAAAGDTGAAAMNAAASNDRPQAIVMHAFTGDPHVASEGRQLFLRYNCYGCHGGLAGGAMGPSLRDSVWKYGGTDSLITASIHEGRPGGMPKWAGIVPDSDIRKLVVYIHSLRTTAEPTFFFSPTDTTTHLVTSNR